MKKLAMLFLAIIITLSLTGCKSKAVRNVEAQIDMLEIVSLEDEERVILAENAYNALTGEEKAEVENYDILITARSTIETEKVAQVQDLIDAIQNENYEKIVELKETWNKSSQEHNRLIAEACKQLLDKDDMLDFFTVFPKIAKLEKALHGYGYASLQEKYFNIIKDFVKEYGLDVMEMDNSTGFYEGRVGTTHTKNGALTNSTEVDVYGYNIHINEQIKSVSATDVMVEVIDKVYYKDELLIYEKDESSTTDASKFSATPPLKRMKLYLLEKGDMAFLLADSDVEEYQDFYFIYGDKHFGLECNSDAPDHIYFVPYPPTKW